MRRVRHFLARAADRLARSSVDGNAALAHVDKDYVHVSTLPDIQSHLTDPMGYLGEKIVIIGGGDAAIENARSLAADPMRGNAVTLIHRSLAFARAKDANVSLLREAEKAGRARREAVIAN